MAEVTDPALIAQLEQPQSKLNETKPSKDLVEARFELLNVIDAARRAKSLSKKGWFTTGFGRETARDLGYTPPKDLDAIINTIASNTAFSRLQKMREESPTGGALGNVTEMELKLLRDTVAGLDPGQSDEAFQGQMDRIIEHYLRAYEKAGGDMEVFDSPKPLNGTDGPLHVTVTADADPVPQAPHPPPPNLGSSTVNTLAGLGQGAAAIVDIPTRALGSLLALPADALGFDETAASLRDPFTIGGAIEDVAPTPQSWGGWGARKIAELGGGGIAFGPKAASAFAENLAGRVPAAPSAFAALRGPATRPVLRDMDALNITPRPALTGGPGARALAALSEATPVGTAFAARAGNKLNDEASRALSNMAGREGVAANAETAGEVATRGALKFRNESRSEISRLYDRASAAAEGIKVAPAATVQALTRHIEELGQNPAADDALPYLTKLRDRLTNEFADGVTVQGIRGMRTSLRDQFYRDGLRGSDIERRVMEAVDSVGDDLANSLNAAGKSEAATLFRQADAAWGARVKTIDDFIMPIIGKKGEKSGEEVFRGLQQAAKSRGVKLKRFIDALPENEAQTVRASLIEGMGKAKNGDIEEFSLAAFLNRWRDLGDTAKDSFFTTDARQSFDSLANVAKRAQAAGRYINYSRSGAIVAGLGTVWTAGEGLATLGTTLAAQTGAALLMTNPSVARILGKFAAAETPTEANAAVRQLTAAAKRNPALAQEIADLQSRLLGTLNDNAAQVSSVAAQDKEKQKN